MIAPLRSMLAAALALGLAGAAAAEVRRVALLVGISDYAAQPRLDGPEHDVAAMRSVLERRWRFRPEDIRTLVNAQATRTAILKEIWELQRRSGSGDEVLIYLSGHGVSAFAHSAVPNLPHGTGAFVPHDYRDDAPDPSGALIVGRTDLRPLIAALEGGGRRIWVISDSCFSGQQVRRLARTERSGPLPERLLPPPKARLRDAVATFGPEARRPAAYPYTRTAFLAAAAEGETAKDISRAHLGAHPTIDGKPHGAFTDALLRVLEGQVPADFDRNGVMSLNEAYRAVADFMASRTYGHSPQRLPSVADDAEGLGTQPVLSVSGVVTAPRDEGPRPLRVAVDSEPEALRRRLEALPDVARVAAGAAHDVALLADRRALALVAASGDLIATGPLDEAPRIFAQVRQLAWAQRIEQISQRGRRAALPVEIEPSLFGGNVAIDTVVRFVVRPDREGTLLLVNIQADGKASVLYPFRQAEMRALPGGQAATLPGIGVTGPEGMDIQFAWAFDERPKGLEHLVGLTGADAADAKWRTLELALESMRGRFSFARTELRTFQRR